MLGLISSYQLLDITHGRYFRAHVLEVPEET